MWVLTQEGLECAAGPRASSVRLEYWSDGVMEGCDICGSDPFPLLHCSNTPILKLLCEEIYRQDGLTDIIYLSQHDLVIGVLLVALQCFKISEC